MVEIAYFSIASTVGDRCLTVRFDWRGMNLGQGGRGWICASGN